MGSERLKENWAVTPIWAQKDLRENWAVTPIWVQKDKYNTVLGDRQLNFQL